MMTHTYHVSCTMPVHFCSPITPEQELETPQYRKRVRGFYQSQEREAKLQPLRIAYAAEKISAMGFDVVSHEDGSQRITFEFKGTTVTFWPYSGWASGKTIKDGRGLAKLLEQIKPEE